MNTDPSRAGAGRLPTCSCGLYAIGECVECDEPVCGDHGVLDDRLRCLQHDRANREQRHARQRQAVAKEQAREQARRQDDERLACEREAAKRNEEKQKNVLRRLSRKWHCAPAEAAEILDSGVPIREWLKEGVAPEDVVVLFRKGIRRTDTAVRRSNELRKLAEPKAKDAARRAQRAAVREAHVQFESWIARTCGVTKSKAKRIARSEVPINEWLDSGVKPNHVGSLFDQGVVATTEAKRRSTEMARQEEKLAAAQRAEAERRRKEARRAEEFEYELQRRNRAEYERTLRQICPSCGFAVTSCRC